MGRLFTMFTSSQGQYLRIMLLMYEARKAGAISQQEMLKQMFLFGVVLPAVFQAIAQGGAEDEEDWWRIAHTVLASPVATVPIGNSFIDVMSVMLLNASWWATEMSPPDFRIGAGVTPLTVMSSFATGVNQMLRQMYKLDANSYDALDWMKAIRNGAQLASLFGIPVTGMAGIPMAIANVKAGDDSMATFSKLVLGMPPTFAIKEDTGSGFTITGKNDTGFTYRLKGSKTYTFEK
jgi:hypothetical protein